MNPFAQTQLNPSLASTGALKSPVTPSAPIPALSIASSQPTVSPYTNNTSTAGYIPSPIQNQPASVQAPQAPQQQSMAQQYANNGVTPSQVAQIQAQYAPVVNTNVPAYSSQLQTHIATNNQGSTPDNQNVVGSMGYDMAHGLALGSSSQDFSVPQNNTFNSTSLGSSNSLSGLLDTRNNMQNSLLNGNPNGQTASNNLYNQVANNLYNSSLYSPDQKQGIQNLANINTQIAATTLADQRMIKSLQENGAMTSDQASAFINDATRRNNADLANLSVAQTAQANSNAVQGQFQQNQIGALTGLSSMLNPQQVAPGSSLYNPLTGVQYQGTGAAPAQIASTAQQLEQSAIQTGNVKTLSDGTVDHNFYTQQAQQYYTTGAFGQGGGISGTGAQVQQTSQIPTLNPQLASYTAQTANGAKYVSQDKLANLTPYEQQQASKDYANAGIPVLTSDQTTKMQNIDVTQQNLNGLQAVVTGIDPTTGQQTGTPLLGSGVFGRIGSAISNTFSSLTQSNPQTAAFNNYRLTAINTLQSLGAGSGGSRITAGEIATAVDNLPNLTDNLETAQAKLKIVDGYLNKWQNELVPNSAQSSNSNGGTIVQTKSGAINTNW